MAKELNDLTGNGAALSAEANTLYQGLAHALGSTLWGPNYFGVRLKKTPHTFQDDVNRLLLDALDVGDLKVEEDPNGRVSSHPYVQKIIQAWHSRKPILPEGLHILWGTGSSGKSAILEKLFEATKSSGFVESDIVDIGDVNSEFPAPIGNNDSMVEFLQQIARQVDDITSADDRIIFIDSISWFDDIPAVAASPAKRNAVPKAWEEFLKCFHRWFVSQKLVAFVTMNPNDDWADGHAAQLQALYSSVAGAYDMASGKAWIRYARNEGIEPRLVTEFDLAWRGSSAHGSMMDHFVSGDDISLMRAPTELK